MRITRGSTEDTARLDFRDPTARTFAHLLVNVLLVTFINFTVWFAITFFVYLRTRSVFATGVIAGIFLVATAATGVWFGSLVDHHRKKTVMQVSALVSLTIYTLALACYLVTPADEWRDPGSAWLWLFIVLLMTGVISGNVRGIALPTIVTALFDERVRDRANGLVGTATGVSHLVTSVASALLVGWNGMLGVLVLAVAVLAGSVLHLHRLRLPETLAHAAAAGEPRRVDVRGTVRVIRGIPGMVPLIAFTSLNNLLMGGLMALLDPYALSMMSVQAWGVIWGALSGVMIVGGLLVARLGTSSNPVRLILLANMGLWVVTPRVPAARFGAAAGRGHGRVHARHAVRRGGRADRAAEGGALRAAGPGVRFRAERRAGGRTADRVPDQSADPVRRHPADDRRRGRAHDRRVVRHRRGARDGAGVRPAGPARPTVHRIRAG
ncbi:MFS transporter [Nocardia farcinica]|uniref:MFS transporter n=1 Tax=Nocardia farcinica TaxID=37329 RepID=UPI001C61145B|nr:MFS transporter [Nocardia farcinica]